ncbi:hypothetical protein QBC32DRAFT_367984 [Pseudoneurospora amorphoporcata]|uniref:AB hydrolase-1 domain-containing protein n=1 Tax=Pseudoneurospora amorphoporcata TaxID=241081 RepID=A0AAN6P200_9PEZI|nr:hypothetical protein QBC32DRAFT_367984 [Pseudoneurospora amorphoporcata]
MSSSPTDIVIIPGGWHTPASYRKFTTALSTALPSLRITVLPLRSITDDPSPTADFYADSAFVRSSVTEMIAEGRHLAIFMHSYGGQVGSNALHRLYRSDTINRGSITHLIYIAAAILFPNSRISVPYGDSRPNVSLVNPSDFEFGPERVIALHPVEMWIGTKPGDKGEATDEEIDEYDSEFAAWMEGKKVNKENGIEENGPQVVEEEVGVDVKVRRMETGHVPALTVTGELVRILGEVLGE